MDLKGDGTFHLDHGLLRLLHGNDDDEREVRRAVRGAAAQAGELLTQRQMDLAASIQAVTEEAVLRMTRSLARETGCRTCAWPAEWP